MKVSVPETRGKCICVLSAINDRTNGSPSSLLGRSAMSALLPGAQSQSQTAPAGIRSSNADTTGGVQVAFSKAGLLKAEQSKTGQPQELTDEEKQQVEQLKSRDREVRQHEQAHMSAAGAAAQGGAHYEYTRGPDGQQYATGGEVSLSVGGGRTPQEMLSNAQQVRRAALAPANPSGQDRRVAAEASQVEQRARMEMVQATRSKTEDTDTGATPATAAPSSNQAPDTQAAGRHTLDIMA